MVYGQRRRSWIRLVTLQEVERVVRGGEPLDCYEIDLNDSCCANGGVMGEICERCPWMNWGINDPLPLTKESLKVA